MKGYKIFHVRNKTLTDMFGNDIENRIEISKKLKIGQCGYHFCENIQDCFLYYIPSNEIVMYEIESNCDLIKENQDYIYSHDLIVCSNYKLIRKIEISEIMSNIKNDYVKYKFARYLNCLTFLDEITDSFAAFKCGITIKHDVKFLPFLKNNDIINWLKYYPADYNYFHTNTKTSNDALLLASHYDSAKCFYDLVDNESDAIQWIINVDATCYSYFNDKFKELKSKLIEYIDFLMDFNMIDVDRYDTIKKISQ